MNERTYKFAMVVLTLVAILVLFDRAVEVRSKQEMNRKADRVLDLLEDLKR